jgi:hypothetical protein
LEGCHITYYGVCENCIAINNNHKEDIL